MTCIFTTNNLEFALDRAQLLKNRWLAIYRAPSGLLEIHDAPIVDHEDYSLLWMKSS